MMRWALGFLVVLSMGCSENSANNEATAVQVGTFNAGLARGYVDHAALRAVRQLSALEELTQMDVLCLQEVWTPMDRAAIIESVSHVFPYSHFQNTTNAMLFPDATAEPAACTMAEADPLAECARPVCEDNPDLATCVLSECGDLFDALSAKCQECAASNIALNDVDEILGVCLREGSVGFAYDGQNGLLLLSTAPIESADFVQFDSFLNSRGVLLGKTHGFEVACTHLTSRLSDPVYSGAYGSYGEENAMQIEGLFSALASRSGDEPQVLMGDFNTGPMVGELSGELTDNFEKFEADGWQNPNTESANPMCTWCESNLITRGSSNEAIDHVFVKGAVGDRPTRILGGDITVTTVDGDEVTTSYSDHFGLSVRLTPQ